MSIQTMKIRATIHIGNITISTPYILSFTVNKVRNSKSTFSASLKILNTQLTNIITNEVVIYAGEQFNEEKIFTGYVQSARPSICFDDPNYSILNISGSDALYKLEGEKYTRRVVHSNARWATIDNVIRKAEKGSQFQFTNQSLQIIDKDIISYLEKHNKNHTDAALYKQGLQNMAANQIFVNFNISAPQPINTK